MEEEIWKDVVGFEEYFRVSNLGNVFSKRSGKVLKQHTSKGTNKRKTIATRLSGRKGPCICLKVHRLVAEAFLDKVEGKDTVNHIDGDASNNVVSNLEWATNAENVQHAFDTGLAKQKKGLDNPLFKLSLAEVSFIKNNYKPRDKNFSKTSLARKFGVSRRVIDRALSCELR